ncbi:hypothetical protein Hdeb2414_s0010g00348031 [Helianthus debilis subsp. tardiflorus]
MGEANSSIVGHQILREWWTTHQERASWEKYLECLSTEAKVFEQSQIKLQEEKVSFEKEKKSKEWGLQRLRNKLQASEELRAKERKEWRASFKEKYEEAKSHRERVEVELNAQVLSKDRDLGKKDAEITELNRRLFKVQEKNESLGIDLGAEKVTADTAEEAHKAAEEARKISASLIVAQTNYAEAQSIVDTMQNHGVAYVANSILNATELDRAVAGLTNAARAVGHRAGYTECTQRVEAALKQHFRTRHCSVNDEVEEMLIKAEEVYDNLSLPIMDLVTGVLKHDDYVTRMKSIFEVPETVEFFDEEEAGGDGAE